METARGCTIRPMTSTTRRSASALPIGHGGWRPRCRPSAVLSRFDPQRQVVAAALVVVGEILAVGAYELQAAPAEAGGFDRIRGRRSRNPGRIKASAGIE